MKRSPLPKRTKPISKLGKKGMARREGKKSALEHFYLLHGTKMTDIRYAYCQYCGTESVLSLLDIHHKKRASQGGTEDWENMAAVHRFCHQWLHAVRAREDAFRVSECNVTNGKVFDRSSLDMP